MRADRSTLVLAEKVREEIQCRVEEDLLAKRSPILTVPNGAAQLRKQVDEVLDEILADLQDQRYEPATETDISTRIGASRAAMKVPPAESLYASRILFEIVLPVLARELGAALRDADEGGAILRLAVAAQQTIMRRVGLSSVAYVNFLLQRIQICQHEERRRVARDLHDRPAHSVGVGLQSLELHDVYVKSDPERSRAKLELARGALVDALDTIKNIAVDLRDSLDDRRLDDALTAYLDNAAPPRVRTTVTVASGLDTIAEFVSEELYLVIREALQNALRHGRPSTLAVTVTFHGSSLIAEVVDDGSGFDPDESSQGVGLFSMRERVELLGGEFEVRSEVGHGTRVHLTIPLVRPAG